MESILMGSTTANSPTLSSSIICFGLENHKNVKIEFNMNDTKKSIFQNFIFDI